MKRLWLAFLIAVLVTLFCAPRLIVHAFAASRSNTSGLKVELAADKAQPRQLEDTTQEAIVRDYASAFKAMEQTLGSNNDSGLAANFAGTALDNLQSRLNSQRKTGVRTRYVDRAHKLEAVFYSPEGSAMQLHDTAQVELQTYDGGTLVSSKPVTLHYIVLMTTAEDRWKVRLLEGVP
jgi:hypothetical protein